MYKRQLLQSTRRTSNERRERYHERMDAKADARAELEAERRAARAAGISPDGDSSALTFEDEDER